MIPLSWSSSLLSTEQLENIHAEALELAERVGLLVDHTGLLSRLAGQEGVRIEGKRVRFRGDRIEAALKAMRFPPSPAPEKFAIICGAYIISVQDIETGEIRAATQQDLIDLMRLGQQLGLCGSPPVRPLDLPEPLQEIAMYKAAWEYSEQRPEPLFDTTPMSTVRSAEVIYEMAQAIGKPFAVGMYLISPFTCPREGLDVIAAFLERQVPMWVGTMPIAGLSAPIFMLGAHVQALAELMAGITLLHALAGDDAEIYWTPIDSVRAHPFDMRYASFVYGSPEDVLGTFLQAQINQRYGVPLVAKSLLTTAREPDEQAAAEKCAHTLAAALAGARIFTNAGFLAVDEYLSPAQTVIDHEIVQYVRRVIQGLPIDAETMAIQAIRDVSLGDRNFLEHETTLQHFRDVNWDPTLFTHVGLKSSQNQRTPSLWKRARSMAGQHIAAADYVLPESDRLVLDKIYRRAEREFAYKSYLLKM